MIITYLRSSSASTWKHCQQKYFLRYCLGLSEDSNKKAVLGTIVHKAVELLARKRLCIQSGAQSFEDDHFGEIHTDSITEPKAIQWAWDYYKTAEDLHDFDQPDWKLINKWYQYYLTYKSGLFHPYNRQVVNTEQVFDFTINEDWARYHYILPDQTTLFGQLAIKGTIDLITKLDNDTLEIIDLKTGKKTNFPAGTEKTLDDMANDLQFLMYYWAVTQLYPSYANIIFTVFYTQCGPYTFSFGQTDLNKIKKGIKIIFNEIQQTKLPKLHTGWWCRNLCSFGRNYIDNHDQTTCQQIHEHIKSRGLDNTMVKYGNLSKIDKYSGAAGRK